MDTDSFDSRPSSVHHATVPSPGQTNGELSPVCGSPERQLIDERFPERSGVVRKEARFRIGDDSNRYKEHWDDLPSENVSGKNLRDHRLTNGLNGEQAGSGYGKSHGRTDTGDHWIRGSESESPDLRAERSNGCVESTGPFNHHSEENDRYNDRLSSTDRRLSGSCNGRSVGGGNNKNNAPLTSTDRRSADLQSSFGDHQRTAIDHRTRSEDQSLRSGQSGDPERVDYGSAWRASSRRLGNDRQYSYGLRSRPKWSPADGCTRRHYTTLRTRDDGGWIKYERSSSASVRSSASGMPSGFGFSSRRTCSSFIYERDPFDVALKRCPKVTFAVVEKATSPIAIEISFGNPQKQMLPSYYYVTADRSSSAVSRRGRSGAGSRTSIRSGSSQSLHVGDKGLPALDSPRMQTGLDPARHEIREFIPEEHEGNDGVDPESESRIKSAKSGIGDAPRNGYKRRVSGAAKRPLKTSSAKSIRLPGKPMTS